eukprot:Partr_v1_DN26452_c1_g1_i2_m24130 putative nuclear assembly factor 1 homolog (S. cerevisiae)
MQGDALVEESLVIMSGQAASVKEELSSSDSSSSSDSESDAEVDESAMEVDIVNAVISDEEEDPISATFIPKTKNELDLPPVEPPSVVQIPDQHPLISVGVISAVVGETVVVQGDAVLAEDSALDIGSILAFEDRQVIGEVSDTFGPITQPFYCIRFNVADDIDTKRAFVGAKVYQSPQFSKVVFAAILRAMKGSDASNFHDEEIPEEEQEFSDDECEQETKSKKKSRKRSLSSQQVTGAPAVSRPAVKSPQLVNVPRGEYVPIHNNNRQGRPQQQQPPQLFRPPPGFRPQPMFRPQNPAYNPGPTQNIAYGQQRPIMMPPPQMMYPFVPFPQQSQPHLNQFMPHQQQLQQHQVVGQQSMDGQAANAALLQQLHYLQNLFKQQQQ